VTRRVAALVHFGLLSRDDNGYRVSELGRHIAAPTGIDDEQSLLQQAVKCPTLYAAVLEQFSDDGHLPSCLSAVLTRNYGIAPNAAEIAADTLVESVKFAGIIDDDLRFISGRDEIRTNLRERNQADDDDPNVRNSSDIQLVNMQKTTDVSMPRTASDGGHQQFRFRLTSEKYAFLEVPGDITARDIAILRKQIELLEAQVESQ
jgi:hypothetical protein